MPRSMHMTRRTLRILRWIALPIILFGPIVRAAWDIRADARVDVGSREVSNARVAEYQQARSPFVDTLLPEGRGGTRFYEDLHGNAGMAFPGAAAIGLSASAALGGWPEAVELHERAHLVGAFLPNDVARLMARLPAPAPDEYAATNSGEHFAEMAARRVGAGVAGRELLRRWLAD